MLDYSVMAPQCPHPPPQGVQQSRTQAHTGQLLGFKDSKDPTVHTSTQYLLQYSINSNATEVKAVAIVTITSDEEIIETTTYLAL